MEGETSLLISPSFSLLNGGSGLACVCTKKHDNLNKMHMHTFFDIRTTHLRQNYWGLTVSFFHYRQKCNPTLSVRAVCFETVTSFDLCWISTFLWINALITWITWRCHLLDEGWREMTPHRFRSAAILQHSLPDSPDHSLISANQVLRGLPFGLFPSILPSRAVVKMFPFLFTCP